MHQVSIDKIQIGNSDKLVLIAGPCVVENREMILETAKHLKDITDELGIQLIFKSSFKKANRSSRASFTGIGDELALDILDDVRKSLNLPVLTDIHNPQDAKTVARYVDVLQVPAFLCRQTDLLIAAGETGLVVNIKKGQFLAPEDMIFAIQKVESTGNERILVTERGTSFGYHNLVVDFRGLPQMAALGYPVVFDATHSVQLPGAGKGVSSGERQYIPSLARAAVAVGVQGLFMEVHPNPEEAKSDAATQLPLSEVHGLLHELLEIHKLVNSFN
jgi:2-dehydro-3-deoxyphosphooctonate aldolase (KDO 8-P synthase)